MSSVAADWLRKDPDKAADMLQQFQQHIGGTLDDVRAIVYNLRPHALDELGLIGAVRQRIEQLLHVRQTQESSGGHPLQIRLHAPDSLPPLPAAVEVGAYRIATEALVNVLKHAQAASCAVRISIETEPDRELVIEIVDDGIGLPDTIENSHANGGVGLTSLRERAVELGGTCSIEKRDLGGTVVLARLPLKSIT